jgi:hypothetical protein
VARKTPRLLELLVREGIAGAELLSRITTEHGVRRLRGEPRVVLADDILVHGRTFRLVHEALESLLPGTQIMARPFASTTSAVANDTRIEPAIIVPQGEAIPLVTSEVSAFGAVAKPFDIDHPIVYVRLSDECALRDVEDAVTRVGKTRGLPYYTLDRRWAPPGGGLATRQVWSLLSPADGTNGRHGELRKVRCYFDPARCRLAIVPIAPRVGTLTALATAVQRTSLASFWPDVDWDPAARDTAALILQQSLVVWANYLLELSELSELVDDLVGALQPVGAVDSDRLVDARDLALILPTGEPGDVSLALNLWLGSPRGAQSRVALQRDGPSDNHVLTPELRAQLERASELDVLQASSQIEAFQSVLQAFYQVQGRAPMDTPSFASGLPLGYMLRLTERWMDPTEDTIVVNRAMDSLVDSGVAVPRFAAAETDEGQLWFRAFHPGEPNANVRAAVMLHALDSLAEALGTNDLPALVTEKLLVLASEHLRVFDAPELRISGGFERRWYLYGARPVVDVAGDKIFAARWAAQRGLIRQTERTFKYRVLKEARRKWSTDALPVRIRLDLSAVARWVATATRDNRLGGRFLTAISSVESEFAYEQALIAELRGWLEGRPNVLGTWGLLREAMVASPATRSEQAATLMPKLKRWIEQARTKQRLRRHLPAYLADADRRWPSTRRDAVASAWHSHVRPGLTAMMDRRGVDVHRVEAAVGLATVVTNILAAAQRDLETDGEQLPRGSTTSKAEAVAASLRSGRWQEIILDAYALEGAARDLVPGMPWPEVAEAIDRLVAGASQATRRVVSRFDQDLRVVPAQGRAFCMQWDLIDSSVRPIDIGLRLEVNRYVAGYAPLIEGFDATATDDANLVVSRDLRTLIKICEEVSAMYGSEHPVRFGIAMSSSIAPLLHVLPAQKPTGAVLELAVRLRDAYRRSAEWFPNAPPEPAHSYCVYDSNVHTYAQRWRLGLRDHQLPGQYRPKFRDPVTLTTYLWRPGERE